MELNDAQKKLFEQYFNELKKLDPEALADEMAIMLVMIPLLPVPRIIKRLKENSKIVRHNKRVAAKKMKRDRLVELCRKKRRTKADNKEVIRLCKALRIDIDTLMRAA